MCTYKKFADDYMCELQLHRRDYPVSLPPPSTSSSDGHNSGYSSDGYNGGYPASRSGGYLAKDRNGAYSADGRSGRHLADVPVSGGGYPANVDRAGGFSFSRSPVPPPGADPR